MRKLDIQVDINKDDFKKKLDIKDGKTPVAGVDFPLPKDGKTPIKGKDYVDGKDGYTPIKGKDYFDGKDGKDGESVDEARVIEEIYALMPTPEKGKDGKDGSPDTGIEIVAKLSELEGKERLSYEDLKDTPIYKSPASRDYDFIELKDTPETYAGHAGDVVTVKSDETGVEFITNITTDEKVKVSANDTTAGYLEGKLIEGNGIDFTTQNDGANETRTITVDETELDINLLGGTPLTVAGS